MSLIFLLGYCLISTNARFALDDFYFIDLTNSHGLWSAISTEYSQASARWSSLFLNFSFLKIFEEKALFTTRLIQIIAFILGLGYLIFNVSERTDIKLSRVSLVRISLYLSCFIFFMTINKSETWFWYCASFTYLWSVIALFYLIGALIKEKRKITDAILMLLTSMYLSGSSAPLALMFLIILTGYLAYSLIRKQKLDGKILLSLVIVLIGFGILYYGPGNRERESYYEEVSLLQIFWINTKAVIKIFGLKFWPLIPYVVLFSLPILFVLPQTVFDKVRITKMLKIKYFLIGFPIIVFIHHFPIAYKLQDIAPDRTLFPFGIYLLLFSIRIVIWITGLIQIDSKTKEQLLRFSLILLIASIGTKFCLEYLSTKQYAQSYDLRMSKLDQQCSQGTTIKLEPLKPSSWMMSAEITENPNHWKNQHLKKALKLNCQISCE